MPKKTSELRREAAALRQLAEMPGNEAIRKRMLDLARKYEEQADAREARRSPMP